MGQLDFALIGNCQSSALIDKKAKIVWACLPRFDSEAIFSSLLGDDHSGVWSILPEDPHFETKQRYLQNTNILKTEFHLKNGDQFNVIDFMPRFFEREEYYRAPQIIRMIKPVKGNPRINIQYSPKFNYGNETPETSITSEGILSQTKTSRIFLQSDIPATYILEAHSFDLTGDKYLVLSHGESLKHPLKFTCEEFYNKTFNYWQTWIKHSNIPFEFQDAVIRSALALKLHIFEDTGAVIAATTTSIPESPDGGRTWDYRYCWLRDAYFVINVLNRLGHSEEMEKFMQYLQNIAGTKPGGELQPVYGIGGEHDLTEHVLPWLKGFKGIGPVRVGNAAYTHAQYDVYGEMVLAVTPLFFDLRLERIDHLRTFDNVCRLVEHAIAAFDKPDSGIWEFRSEQKHYLFSKLLCWAAVDRGIKIATKLGLMDQHPLWVETRTKMRDHIESKGWNEELGFYSQAILGTNPDASNLLMSAINFHSGKDEKFKRMVESYEKGLMNNGYMFRYKNEDDFGFPKHAFTVCTFWMIDALASIGRTEEAKVLFKQVLSRVNHVGLLSEDIDPVTGELWGNFPQTYSHVGIINSAFRLSKSWDEAF